MKEKGTQLLAMLLCICMVFGLTVQPARAEDAATEPVKTSNLGMHGYMYDRWANPIGSYLVDHGDGTFTRVEHTDGAVVVETYDSDLRFVSGRTVSMELPLFGGFYSGQDYNFLVFGQTNTEEDDAKEVIRVVSYTKSWQRVGAASLYGANTTVPFDAGTVRFAEYGGYLYIRTAHEMYTSSDGRNHQANVMLNVRISDMTIAESLCQVANSGMGYVSHSFNQFVAVDGTTLLAVDHGDAYPRSVVLFRYHAPAGQDSFLEATMVDLGDGSYTYEYVQSVDVLPIAGAFGDNDTGVNLGGFACSDSAYLVAGCTVSQGDDYDPYGQKNIFITVTDKNHFTAEGTSIRYLTSHAAGAGVTVSNPHFVPVTDSKYAILWTETVGDTASLRYGFVDGSGQLMGQIYTTAGVLSDCQPIVSGGKLIWYVTNGSGPAFFTIDLENPEDMTHDHLYVYDYLSYPTYNTPGALSATCAVCGAVGETVEIPAICNKDQYTLTQCTTQPTCTEGGYGYFLWNDVHDYGAVPYSFWAPVDPTGHDYVDGICSACGDDATAGMDLSGDGKITAFDAQMLAEAKAGRRDLTEEQTAAIGTRSPMDIIEWILGLFSR